MSIRKLEEVIRNRSVQETIANACDRAYAEGVGHPEWYSPFTATGKPEHFARNLAGLTAVVSGLGFLASYENLPLDNNVVELLERVVEFDELPAYHKETLLRLANLSWNAGQPFIGGPDLSRIDRLNVFDSLPPAEVAKDRFQIVAAASELLKVVDS